MPTQLLSLVKITILSLIMLFGLSFIFKKKVKGPLSSIHQFKAKTIDGQEFDFSTLKGKKVLVVNTASECGLTPQYKQLEEVYEKYKDKNFTIIGFPANNFGAQEPGTNTEIKTFCTKNYGVTFQLMEKVSVKGSDMCEVYQWLTQKEKNGVASSTVKWNFQKYMIDEEGHLVDSVSPAKKPNCDKIINWIEGKK
jgi:glutathione peroxidase